MAKSPPWQGDMTADGRPRSRSRKLRGHVFSSMHEAERANRKWDPAVNFQSPPPVMYFLRRVTSFYSFPNSATNWTQAPKYLRLGWTPFFQITTYAYGKN